MKFNSRWLAAAPIVVGLLLGACDRGESVPQSVTPSDAQGQEAQSPAYARDIMALKARETDPKKISDEIANIQARYGYVPTKAPEDAQWYPTLVPQAAPLAKVAAGPVTQYLQVKYNRINNYVALHFEASVGAGQTFSATATPKEQGVDPVLVAFYKTSGTSSACRVKLIGLNDDFGGSLGLGSFISWTNNTGATKSVRVLAYVYNENTFGNMNLVAKVTYQQNTYAYSSVTKNVGARLDYDYNFIPNSLSTCGAATASRIWLRKSQSLTTGTGILAINPVNMTGSFIRETNATLDLPEVMPEGRPYGIVAFWEADGYTSEASYPYNEWYYGQNNLYTCYYP
jgi:hypothetical protein